MGEAIRTDRAEERCTDALVAEFCEAMTGVRGTFEEREAAGLALTNELMRRWIADELHAPTRTAC